MIIEKTIKANAKENFHKHIHILACTKKNNFGTQLLFESIVCCTSWNFKFRENNIYLKIGNINTNNVYVGWKMHRKLFQLYSFTNEIFVELNKNEIIYRKTWNLNNCSWHELIHLHKHTQKKIIVRLLNALLILNIFLKNIYEYCIATNRIPRMITHAITEKKLTFNLVRWMISVQQTKYMVTYFQREWNR